MLSELPDWAKSTGLFLGVMILWDIARLFIQAYVNKLFMKKDFEKISNELDDIDETLEEEYGEESKD